MKPQNMHPCLRCLFYFGTSIPLIFILAILSWSYYAYVVALCINTIPSSNIAEKILLIILFHIFLIMFLWAYLQTTITGAAAPPRQFHLSDDEWIKLQSEYKSSDLETVKARREYLNSIIRKRDLPVFTRGYNESVRICEDCKLIKPDRSHHCSTCGQCMLKMDHHCPWVNNCVGFHNYKFFVLFLFYGAIYCIYIGCSSAKYFVDFWATGINGGVEAARFHVLFVFFAAWMFAVSLCGLGGYHLYLTLMNQTTLESFRAPVLAGQGPDKRAYYAGKCNNFRQVFGDSRCLWLIPVFTSVMDGYTWTPRMHSAGNNNANYASISPDSQGTGLTYPSGTNGTHSTNLLSDTRDVEIGLS